MQPGGLSGRRGPTFFLPGTLRRDVSLRIRPAGPADVEGIRAVARRAWHAAHAPILGTEAVESFLAEHYDRESFRERIDRQDTILDVAVDADGVVGYVLASPAADASATFALGHIYLDPDRWREGIGRRLLAHAERTVTERDGERLALSVMADNDRAVGFYEAAGYRRVEAFHDERLDAAAYTYAKALG